jgi:hypothetical protein
MSSPAQAGPLKYAYKHAVKPVYSHVLKPVGKVAWKAGEYGLMVFVAGVYIYTR